MLRPTQLRVGPTFLVICCVTVGGLCWPGLAAAAPPAPPHPPQEQEESGASQEILERGEAVYVDQCVSCHGAEGEGDGPAARFLEAEPRDFTAGEWQYATEGTVEALATVVRDGIDDTAMTPFSDMLTEEEIVAVVTYVLEELAGEADGGGASGANGGGGTD